MVSAALTKPFEKYVVLLSITFIYEPAISG